MTTLLGVAIAAAWIMLQPRVYTASANGYVSSTNVSSDPGSSVLGNSLAQAQVGSYIEMGTWETVAQRVIEATGIDASPSALVSRVNVTNPTDTVIVRVTATGASPTDARDLAQAWIAAMADEIRVVQLGAAAGTPSSEVEGTAQLQLVSGGEARLPSSPSSPNIRLALAVGALAGLIVGVAYAALRYVLDRRIRSAEQVERETGVPVVGTIPEVKDFSFNERLIPFGDTDPRSLSNDMHAVSEAMRTIRSNLQFMNVDNPPRVIVVSSPLPGDGKSTTSANLAITLAAAGQRVILIDGDLRRPTISTIFHLIEGAGLTDVLAGNASIEQVAHAVGDGNLVVVGAGQIPPNPSELLGSERMHELLQMLAEQAIVIIDAPPLIPVTDAAVLARRTDGAIVVTKVGSTTSEVLQQALRKLEQVSATALGVVLNRVPMRGAGAVYYGYQYRGGYYGRSENEPAEGARLTRRRRRPQEAAPATEQP